MNMIKEIIGELVLWIIDTLVLYFFYKIFGFEITILVGMASLSAFLRMKLKG